MLWIPPGFAHGFLVVSDAAEFLYKTTDYWYPQHERSLLWSDPALGIRWPLSGAPGRSQGRQREARWRRPTLIREASGDSAFTGAAGQLGFELAPLLTAHGEVGGARPRRIGPG